jgi:hypothetical protein
MLGGLRVVNLSALVALFAAGAVAATGCGDVKPGRGRSAKASVTPGALRPGTKPAARGSGRSVAARIDVASDRVLAEGKIHIAAGAPSDKEVRREI